MRTWNSDPITRNRSVSLRSKLFPSLAATSLVAVFAVFATTPVAAQSCGACKNFWDDDEITGHYAVSWWNASGPDDTPNDYHFTPEDGSCKEHHDWCDSDQLQLAEAVVDAVDRADLGRLAALMTASPAVIVESRRAIQIPGCEEDIIVGHVPLDDGLMASLRAAVAEAAVAETVDSP